MEKKLFEHLFFYVADRDNFPIKVPLFSGVKGGEVADHICAFQKNNGKITLFQFYVDTSFNEITDIHNREEFGNLKELFMIHPEYIKLVRLPLPQTEMFVLKG